MRLKEILDQKHISGAELARKLGVTTAYISLACTGKANLSIKQCEKIAQVLDIPLASLFEGYAEPDTIECPYCHRRIKLVKDEG